MGTFRETRRRLAEHRVRLELDVRAGTVPPSAFATADACFAGLSALLDAARIEVEAAGPHLPDPGLPARFVGGCARLGRRVARATHRQVHDEDLQRTAVEVRREAQALKEVLWAGIEGAT